MITHTEQLILAEIRGMRGDIQNLAVEQGRVAERLDNHIEKMDEQIEADEETHKDFEKRIRKTEDFVTDLKARVGTWAAIIGAVAGLAADYLKSFFTGGPPHA